MGFVFRMVGVRPLLALAAISTAMGVGAAAAGAAVATGSEPYLRDGDSKEER